MKRHITLIILALFGLTSCGSVAQLSQNAHQQKFQDGIYYRPSPEDIAQEMESIREAEALIEKTRSSKILVRNGQTDTLVIPESMAANLTIDKLNGTTTVSLVDINDLWWRSSFRVGLDPFNWSYARWNSAWYYNSFYYDHWFWDWWSYYPYYPSLGYRYGWYTGLYDPWFYDPWYFDPWYYGRWYGGYYPWYDPYYYPGGGYSIGREGIFHPEGASRVVNHGVAGRTTGSTVARRETGSGIGASRQAVSGAASGAPTRSSSAGTAVVTRSSTNGLNARNAAATSGLVSRSSSSTAISAGVPRAVTSSGDATYRRSSSVGEGTRIISSGNNASGRSSSVSSPTRSSSYSNNSSSVSRSSSPSYSGGSSYSGGGSSASRSSGSMGSSGGSSGGSHPSRR